MRSFKTASIVTSALLASTVLANAADLTIVEPEYVPEVRTVHTGGWYLRGDLGYSHMSTDNVRYHFTDATFTVLEQNFNEYDLGSSWMIGGGIGYQINDHFRVDATLNYYGAVDFSGKSAADGYFCDLLSADDGDNDTCSVSDTSEFQATTIMANAYVDLGTYAGFTPYIGGGIGGAKVHWNDLDNDIICDGVGNCLDAGGLDYDTDFDTVHGGASGWRFAYALHAGTSYDLTQNLKLDAGYSWTRISGGDMFDFAPVVGSGTQGDHDDITIHTWRAGLRYQFN